MVELLSRDNTCSAIGLLHTGASCCVSAEVMCFATLRSSLFTV